MEKTFDVENMLLNVQIDYMKKEMKYMKDHFMGHYRDHYGRDHNMDYDFMKITSEYEQLIDDSNSEQEKLEYYKKMFLECYNLTYQSIMEEPCDEPLLYEKCMCGTDSVLMVEDVEIGCDSD